MRRILPFLLLLPICLSIAGCDIFRDPDEGFDREWSPDHGDEDGPDNRGEDEGDIDLDDATGSLPDDGNDAWVGGDDGDRLVSARRPADILADTAGLPTSTGAWEKEGVASSDFTIYGSPSDPDLIVERIDGTTRTYYFNDGYLFYYTEESDDGSSSMTVEFDDLGDVRGSQKIVNGKRVGMGFDDFSEIVEHAMELRRE